jgi:transposase InsO family protein
MDRTDDGRPIKMLTLVDEFARECLAIHVARRIRATDVIDVFADVMQTRGVPEHIRTLREAQVLVERWRVHYNTVRPHGSLGYRPPAPETAYARPLIAEELKAA